MSRRAPVRPVWTRLLVQLAVGAGATGLAYGTLLGYRSDYLGHYLAGFGGTLLLVAFPLAVSVVPRWSVVALVGLAIGIGGVMEATIYRLAIFDPVDFLNQSLGAVMAGCLVIGRRRSFPAAVVAVIGGLALLWLGFRYAFA